MDVHLYVYDLTRGMARAMSRQFLGIQIDAVYHTSIVFGNVEYFFGAGVQTCFPGSTHHGRPMEITSLGVTHLPMDTILEYLESLKEVYTPESYDLFTHNCNNFSNDFGMFLVGKGTPEHITNLPQRVLDTPFGQMLKPQIDASMRSITQAEVPSTNIPARSQVASDVPHINGTSRAPSAATINGRGRPPAKFGSVINVTKKSLLDEHLASAKDSCATIFFTSSTCAPCKLAYQTYDTLSMDHSHALFLKVDINEAGEIASHFGIRATPTFMSFVKGTKSDEWVGADPGLLKSNVQKALQQAFPSHPHSSANAPILQYGSLKPVTYSKVPPLDKLTSKLGASASEPAIVALRSFIEHRQRDPRDAPLPDLQVVCRGYQETLLSLPADIRFASIDLLRCAIIDPRMGGYFAEEPSQLTITKAVQQVEALGDKCPHSLRLVTIHLASNLFSADLFVKEMMHQDNELVQQIVQLVASSLLDATHPTTRVAAASLAFNIATANYRTRREADRESVSEGVQVELAASILETMRAEDSDEALKALLLSLGYLLYFAPEQGDLGDLCQAMEATSIVSGCTKHARIANEVVRLLSQL